MEQPIPRDMGHSPTGGRGLFPISDRPSHHYPYLLELGTSSSSKVFDEAKRAECRERRPPFRRRDGFRNVARTCLPPPPEPHAIARGMGGAHPRGRTAHRDERGGNLFRSDLRVRQLRGG